MWFGFIEQIKTFDKKYSKYSDVLPHSLNCPSLKAVAVSLSTNLEHLPDQRILRSFSCWNSQGKLIDFQYRCSFIDFYLWQWRVVVSTYLLILLLLLFCSESMIRGCNSVNAKWFILVTSTSRRSCCRKTISKAVSRKCMSTDNSQKEKSFEIKLNYCMIHKKQMRCRCFIYEKRVTRDLDTKLSHEPQLAPILKKPQMFNSIKSSSKSRPN